VPRRADDRSDGSFSGHLENVLGSAQWKGDVMSGAEVESRLAGQLTGDRTGALTYEQALAETDKLLQGAPDSDGLLSQRRCSGYKGRRAIFSRFMAARSSRSMRA
jgi:hypothetical protein